MPIEKLMPSFHFEAERIEHLKQIAPEAFADGKINWEALQEALGDFLEEENSTSEHFGLFWPGKKDARKMASTPSLGTLIPCPGEGIDEENTKNIFIEGENLEVLKLIQKAYPDRIKLIYIDPPYNTGKDFVYDDNFSESIDEYLKRTGQLDEEAKLLSTNKKSDGRFHSKWLTMMYPRLRLARNLLRDDGILFVSIDDNEFHNLKQLLNEVFGEENFIASIIWRKKYGIQNDAKFFSVSHEYLLCYAKSKDYFEPNLLDRTDTQNDRYKNPDNDKRGPWKSADLSVGRVTAKDRYEIITPSGRKVMPPQGRSWVFSKEKFKEMKDDNRIWFGESGNNVPSVKKFLTEVRQGLTPTTFWDYDEVGHTDGSNKKLKELFDGKAYFDYPKPVDFIKKAIKIGSEDNDYILDFFGGSGTTAQAVMELNLASPYKKNYICVQMPELIDADSEAYKDGYRAISEITLERIKRVHNEIETKNTNKKDIGFKVFKLQKSNFKLWNNYTGNDMKVLESLFASSVTPLVEGWQANDLIFEIILMEGFPLDSKLQLIDSYKHNTVTQVTSDFCEHKLLICLDTKMNDKTIQALNLAEDDIFICLDSAISDKDKVTLQDKGLIKTI